MIEKQDVEFKREYNDKVNKTMLAFLNTDGGTLYLGMVDDSSIFRIGSNTVMATREHIRQMIKDNGMGHMSVVRLNRTFLR